MWLSVSANLQREQEWNENKSYLCMLDGGFQLCWSELVKLMNVARLKSCQVNIDRK